MMRFSMNIVRAAAVLCCLCAAPVLLAAQGWELTLDDCLTLASQNDPYVRNARLDVLAARAQRQEALAEYFPTVSATAMAFHALNPFINIGVTDILGRSDAAWNISNFVDEQAPQYGLPTRFKALHYGYGATISVMQPVYAGGRIVSGNALARLGVEAASVKQRLQERQSGVGVEQKYWLVVSLQEKQLTLSKAQEMLDSLEKDVLSALAAGVVTESEVLQVKLKKSELSSAGIRLRGGLRLAKMDLFNAIGYDYCTVSALASDERPCVDDVRFSSIPENLPDPQSCWCSEDDMAASMAETQLLEMQLKAKRLERRMVLGEALPEVAVGGMYGYGKYLGDGKTNGALFAMVSIPLSQWGKTARKLQRCDIDIEKTANEKEYLDAQLVLKARKLWVDLTTSWEQMQLAQETVALAGDSVFRLSEQYRAGLIPLSELLQAETSLRQAEDGLIDARIAYCTALSTYNSCK